MIGISEQRGEGERLQVGMLVGNNGDEVEEEGIERESIRKSIRNGQLVPLRNQWWKQIRVSTT